MFLDSVPSEAGVIILPPCELSDPGDHWLDIYPRYVESGPNTPLGDIMSSPLNGKRVLLVDDDNDILTSMQAAFEPTGVVLDLASNGNKAVELAEKNSPDVVILDMMLPGRSGFLVLEKIKARKPRGEKPHVIMITGNQGARHKDFAHSLGVSEYFTKPVKMDKLVSTAERLVSPPAPAQ